MKKIATIDLGTNGFRLYIAETSEAGHFMVVHREVDEVKLASDGFDRIGDAPFERGLAAMRHFATVLREWKVDKVAAFGTAALRLAANGQDFISQVKAETNVEIQLISGEREAALIYKGMKLGIPHSMEPVLMVDVGGGSVEFIIANSERVFWSKSFNVGVTILKQKFHKANPIETLEIIDTQHFLNQICTELLINIQIFKPKIPVIACGTLDFLTKILRGRRLGNYEVFSLADFRFFHGKLTFMTDAELENTPHVPAEKVEMLAVSMVLMDWVMQKLNAEKMIASGNSMKSGILYEMSLLAHSK